MLSPSRTRSSLGSTGTRPESKAATGRAPAAIRRPLAERRLELERAACREGSTSSTSSPGKSCWLTARTTSSAESTGSPSIATMRSPPTEPARPRPRAPSRRPQPGAFRRASVDDLLDGRAPLGRSRTRSAGHARRDGLGRDPEPGVAHLAGLDQLLHRSLRRVDGDREADALRGAALAADLRVDPDDLAAGVEHRAARVAAVDRRVRLDRVDEVVARGHRVDRALGRRDDADAQRALLAERAADRSDRLADDHGARVAERHRAHRDDRRVDLEKPDVVEEVPADDLRGNALAVPELDVHRATAARRLRLVRLAGGRDRRASS